MFSNLVNKLLGRYSNHPEAVIISCFFNPQNSEYRRKAFDIWYQTIKHLNHRIVECIIGEGESELVKYNDKDISLVQTPSLLWHKEALLNKVISELPKKFKYVFWVDADVLFTNKNWLTQSVKVLRSKNILQPFAHCTHMDKNETKPSQFRWWFDYTPSEINTWDSFCYTHVKTNGLISCVEEYNAHGHVGFAWGARREILDKVPLYDKALIGGADHIIAHAAAGHIPHKCIQKSFTDNLEEVEDYSRRLYSVVQGNIGYVPGDLYHIWHGDIKKRQYLKRIQDFTKSTKKITEKDKNGLYVTEKDDGYIREYFKNREVDDKTELLEIFADALEDIGQAFSTIDDAIPVHHAYDSSTPEETRVDAGSTDVLIESIRVERCDSDCGCDDNFS